MSSGIAAMVVAGTWFVVFVVLYLGFGGRMPFYRYPIRMIVAGMLSFLVAMMLAFVLFAPRTSSIGIAVVPDVPASASPRR